MKKFQVFHYDAFTTSAGLSNPSGVIFNSDNLSDDEMQKIAKLVGFNECAFISKSTVADVKLRYFTPGHEMNLCGHGTIAAICALMEREKDIVIKKIETLAGILDIQYNLETNEVKMTQANAEFKEFIGNKDTLAKAIGLRKEDIDERYPIVYGSTGTWTLILPIKSLDSFYTMIPNNKLFPEILNEMPYSSVHPITLETIHSINDMHGRHFSSYYSGTVEDPVTGTASGVMGAYYLKYIKDIEKTELLIEQGQEIGKEGLVHVWAEEEEDIIKVSIAGTAVIVKEIEVII